MPDPWKAMREARLAREQAARDADAEFEAEMARQEAELMAALKGDKGDKGDPGDPGPAGRDGLDGRPGVDGVPGADGAAGRDGMDGMAGAPGSAGRDGIDGAPGKPGVRGPQGVPGPTVVKSEFRRDSSQRISMVVEYLGDGSERTFTVQRDAAGRPVELTLG